MFDPTDSPRIYGLPPGADFPAALVDGLTKRSDDLSRTVIYVNTLRMQRRLRTLFDTGPARLLPRVRVVTDLGVEAATSGIAMPQSPLRQRLELFPLVRKLFETTAGLADRTAAFDWADSLATLMEEMHGEGVGLDKIASLDVSDQSGHWQRTQAFLKIIAPYFVPGTAPPDHQARLRLVAEDLARRWQDNPPDHPVIVAGSTGSRGATQVFMQAVARLPQGALVLPGFDFDMPDHAWTALDDPLTSEDHPQYRFRKILDALHLTPQAVRPWLETGQKPARNRLVSLSLRPAPVTDQWRQDGPALGDLNAATADITLLEADSPRAEAAAIALRLRQAAAEGLTAALITPDRTLTRQVTAALDRWNITPDDSAGIPLAQTASGRLLRHAAEMMGRAMTAADLLVILKHPLTNTSGDREQHLLRARRLELKLRRYGPPFLTNADLADWANHEAGRDPGVVAWAAWLGQIVTQAARADDADLTDHLRLHLSLAEQLSAGPGAEDTGKLWAEKAGREARIICDRLIHDADAGGPMAIMDYIALFNAVLSAGTVRDRDAGDPRILIWGTLEARVGGADLVILGGMNDGTWPETSKPDPWLNRQMRQQAGLLLPERRIGLSAHDYQQAIAAPQVWISRAKRSADAETVPSRWVNRLINLMGGLPDQNGPAALAAMRARGDLWLRLSETLDRPTAKVAKEGRPSPRPPAAARPTNFSVTQIKTLIRDPFAIYARKVLRLSALDPLVASADAPLRGEIYHRILETFIGENHDPADPAAAARLLAIAADDLEINCPWPTVRLQWMARLEQLTPGFLSDEIERRSVAATRLTEARGDLVVGNTGVTLTARADRIDETPGGEAVVYDYKTGTVPTGPQQEKFDKQLILTTAMIERGAFAALGPMPVAGASFLGINKELKVSPAPLEKAPPDAEWDKFCQLLHRWQNPTRGYTARMAMFTTKDVSDYDHLSRFGEWDDSDPINPVDLR